MRSQSREPESRFPAQTEIKEGTWYIKVRREGRIRLGSVSSNFCLLPPDAEFPAPTAPGGTRVPILLFGGGVPAAAPAAHPEPAAGGGRLAWLPQCRRVLAAIAAIGDAAAAPEPSAGCQSVPQADRIRPCARGTGARRAVSAPVLPASRAPREAGARGAILLLLHSQRSRPRAVQPVQAASD